MRKAHNRIEYQPGQKINRLTFIKETEPKIFMCGARPRRAKFKCHCGKEFITNIQSVRNGNTASCGCYHIHRATLINTKHGLRQHPLYAVWCTMKARCYNLNNKRYKNYGERGIKVCKTWRESFKTFYDWCIANGYERGLTIDRINNNGNYEPSNCRFVTNEINSQNRHNTKLNLNIAQEIRNARLLIPELTVDEISHAYSVDASTIYNILNHKVWRNI